ncbi:MAG TPA: protein kinase, partial [Ktedonobacteraceae bacterium]|nr:protein kinase [Ktedonobacteraceae bacterium]
MSEMPLQHRATIGSYQLLQFIGPGPISRVYRGKHQDSPQQKVAVKILEAISLQSTEAQQQILQEITSLAALQHPQILPVLEANLDNNILYLVSQLQTGSLRQRLDNT